MATQLGLQNLIEGYNDEVAQVTIDHQMTPEDIIQQFGEEGLQEEMVIVYATNENEEGIVLETYDFMRPNESFGDYLNRVAVKGNLKLNFLLYESYEELTGTSVWAILYPGLFDMGVEEILATGNTELINYMLEHWDGEITQLNNKSKDARSYLRKKEKEERDNAKAKATATQKATQRLQKEQEKMRAINVTVRFQGNDYVVQVLKGDYFKQLREALRRLHPAVFKTGKMLKSLRFTYNDKVLNDHVKTELQNFGIVEGSVVLAVLPTGAGNDGGYPSGGNNNSDNAEDENDDDDDDDDDNDEPRGSSDKTVKSKAAGPKSKSSKDAPKDAMMLNNFGEFFTYVVYETDVKKFIFGFHYDKTTKCDELLHVLSDQQDLFKPELFTVWVGPSYILPYETLHAYTAFDTYKTLTIKPNGLMGGVGGMKVKKVLKQDEAKSALIKSMKKRYEVEEDIAVKLNTLPDEFQNYVRSIKEQISNLQVLRTRIGAGGGFVSACLKQVSDEDINMLYSILTKKGAGKNYTADEKSEKCLFILYPSLVKMEEAKECLSSIQTEVMGILMQMIAEEFPSYKGETPAIDLKTFTLLVDGEKSRRERPSMEAPEMTSSGCVTV